MRSFTVWHCYQTSAWVGRNASVLLGGYRVSRRMEGMRFQQTKKGNYRDGCTYLRREEV